MWVVPFLDIWLHLWAPQLSKTDLREYSTLQYLRKSSSRPKVEPKQLRTCKPRPIFKNSLLLQDIIHFLYVRHLILVTCSPTSALAIE